MILGEDEDKREEDGLLGGGESPPEARAQRAMGDICSNGQMPTAQEHPKIPEEDYGKREGHGLQGVTLVACRGRLGVRSSQTGGCQQPRRTPKSLGVDDDKRERGGLLEEGGLGVTPWSM